MNIEITEGCVCFSYLINNKEWVDYETEKEKEFLNRVCEKLIKQIVEQYNIPHFLEDYLWDGDYDIICSQDTFIKLVKNNKNTKEKYLGRCDCCGDSIHKWTLNI